MTASPPPSLPKFIFILSDYSTRILSCEVAEQLQKLDPDNLRVWDFREPLSEALHLMWPNELPEMDDWSTDFGDPRCLPDEFKDRLIELEKWFNDVFGPDRLGRMHLVEAQSSLVDSTIIYRDATWLHIQPFLSAFKPHEVLIIDLNPTVPSQTLTGPNYPLFAKSHILFANPTAETVVQQIIEASK